MNPAAVEFALGVPGWMRDVELAWLSRKAASLSTGSVWCEVGTWMGRSWSAIALSMQPGLLISVDTFDGGEFDAEPRKYVAEHGPVLDKFIDVHETVRKMRPDLMSQVMVMESVLAAIRIPNKSCDVIFIDGDHRTAAVLADIKAWRPKLKKGGLLCGHDGDHPDVQAALEGMDYSVDPSDRGSIWCLE